MKTLLKSIILSTSLIITGCSGGGSNSPSSSIPVVTPPVPNVAPSVSIPGAYSVSVNEASGANHTPYYTSMPNTNNTITISIPKPSTQFLNYYCFYIHFDTGSGTLKSNDNPYPLFSIENMDADITGSPKYDIISPYPGNDTEVDLTPTTAGIWRFKITACEQITMVPYNDTAPIILTVVVTN